VLDEMTFEKATGLKGTSLWAYPEQEHKVELRVEEVLKVMESEAARLKRTAFSMFLLGPSSYPMTQGIIAMTHEAFPEPFELFIVPVEQRVDGYLYEAVFT
jgi:hypothetical protein